MTEAGIQVHDLEYADGTNPSKDHLAKWRQLVKEARKNSTSIAVHCIAGLGRAPVMVCTTLIDSGMEPLEAVKFVRERRKGAINAGQLKYLRNYKKPGADGCSVM
eukprot:CAMPEP_0119123332 /NCGR_PEP_ID=MMETSP1310-20130426/3310_1 /TAXON_ID=464262 /ORGANISM="Genus nov. species nov., Strain RCC2339" /LENGTH=104 /DNA_ID=CAMNT_0007113123 /DNA_START=466 /DNA_END=780 /DNA_ORIENTATION=+